MSTFQIYFEEDPELGIGATQYGILISAAALPNLLLPLFGGTLFDTTDHRLSTIAFLFLALFGQIIFATGITVRSFPLALLGVVIFGTGNGSSIVAERAIISQQFHGKEVTFALGASVATSALSKFVGRALVAPVADAFGSYLVALWGTCLFILLSILSMLVYCILSTWEESWRQEGEDRVEGEPGEDVEALLLEEERKQQEPRTGELVARKPRRRAGSISVRKLVTQARDLPVGFWVVAMIHTNYHIVYRMFINFSASFIREKWHTTVTKAGYISSLVTVTVVFVAPLSGFVMDWVGGRLYILMLSGMVTVFAFGLLAFSDLTPVVGVVLLSISESFIPTISMALIPEVTPAEFFGIGECCRSSDLQLGFSCVRSLMFTFVDCCAAFGVIEVLNAVANLSSNTFMGWLRDYTRSYDAGMACVFFLSLFGCMSLMALFLWDRTINDQRLNTSQLRMKGQTLGDEAVVAQTPAVLAIEAPMHASEVEMQLNEHRLEHVGRPRRHSV